MSRFYLGEELYNKIDEVIDKSFHKSYTRCSENSYEIEKVEMDYRTCEDDKDLPIINVTVYFHTLADGNLETDVPFNLSETDEYNVGYIARWIDEYAESNNY